MTAPTLARTSSDGRRVYPWPPPPAQAVATPPSVTAILNGGIPKEGLARWASKQAGIFAGRERKRMATLPEHQVVAEVKVAPWAQRDGAAGLGTAVHTIVEALINRATVLPSLPEGVRAGQVHPYVSAFRQFDRDFQPRWLLSEQTVFNLRHGYAGTLDAICVLDGRTVLLDVKTGKSVYPEVALQLAAYANAEFIGTPDGRQLPLPQIDTAAVLHLRPEGYALRAVRCDAEVYAAFLAALGVFRWTTRQAHQVLGRHLLPRLSSNGGGLRC